VAPFKKSHLIENEIEYNALEKKIFLIDAKPFAQKKEKKNSQMQELTFSRSHMMIILLNQTADRATVLLLLLKKIE
jgi:hypothetical protein